MATCPPGRRVCSLDSSQLNRCPPPSPLVETCSRRGCHARRLRWGAHQPKWRSRCEAAVDAASADAPAVSPVPVITTAEPDTDTGSQPYTMHSWQWRGHKINYATAGCGKPVLLIHGFGASLGHFRKNIPALCAAGYKARRQPMSHRVYAIDLLAFGASAKPILEYTVELWQDLVVDFLAEFVDAPAVLVGNSLGSLIALAAAVHAPDDAVAGVVLINCAGGMNNKAISDDWRIKLAMPIFLLVDALLARPKVARYLFDRFRTRDNLRTVLKGVYSDGTAVDDALVDLIYSPSCELGALEAFVSIISGPPGPRPEQLLERIPAPLLVLWGDRDTFTPIDGPVGRYFRRLPDVREKTRLQVLPGVGHCPHDDVPALVNDAMTAWLAEYH